jgi:hypothetical protein
MTAQRFAVKVEPDGKVGWPELHLQPGAEFEIIMLPLDELEGSADLSTLLAADTLRHLWDTPEEDEAWAGSSRGCGLCAGSFRGC